MGQIYYLNYYGNRKVYIHFIPKKEKELRAKLLGRNVNFVKQDFDNLTVELNNNIYEIKSHWLNPLVDDSTLGW